MSFISDEQRNEVVIWRRRRFSSWRIAEEAKFQGAPVARDGPPSHNCQREMKQRDKKSARSAFFSSTETGALLEPSPSRQIIIAVASQRQFSVSQHFCSFENTREKAMRRKKED